jgi:hypothetical protein
LDGGYIIAGYTNSFGAGSYDVYLIKTDASGNAVWSRTYGGSNDDRGNGVRQTQDGGYIVAGFTTSFGAGGNDVYLIKTDAAGNATWTRTYGGSANDAGQSVQQTQESGYIVVGYTVSFGAGSHDVYLIKTDAAGNATWTRTYGGSNNDDGFSVQQTLNGGYIITGSTSSFGAGGADVYTIKTDAAGNAAWTRTNGGPYLDSGNGVQQTTDGGYIIAGCTASYGAGSVDVYLIRLAAETLPLEITLTPVNPPIVIPANGGNFQFDATVRRTQPPQTSFYVWARDRYPNGTYSPTLLGPVQINPSVGVDVMRRRTQVIPGTYPAGNHYYVGYAGATVAYPAVDADSFSWTMLSTGDGNPWTAEASNFGEPFPGEENPPLSAGRRIPAGVKEGRENLSISPNPFNASTALSYELRAASFTKLKVYDISGRLVAMLAEGWSEAGEYGAIFDGSKLATGVYLVRLEVSGSGTTPTTEVRKVVLLK